MSTSATTTSSISSGSPSTSATSSKAAPTTTPPPPPPTTTSSTKAPSPTQAPPPSSPTTSQSGSSSPTSTSSSSSSSVSDNGDRTASFADGVLTGPSSASTTASTTAAIATSDALTTPKSFFQRPGAVGGVFGAVGVVAVGLTIFFIFLCWRRKRSNDKQANIAATLANFGISYQYGLGRKSRSPRPSRTSTPPEMRQSNPFAANRVSNYSGPSVPPIGSSTSSLDIGLPAIQEPIYIPPRAQSVSPDYTSSSGGRTVTPGQYGVNRQNSIGRTRTNTNHSHTSSQQGLIGNVAPSPPPSPRTATLALAAMAAGGNWPRTSLSTEETMTGVGAAQGRAWHAEPGFQFQVDPPLRPPNPIPYASRPAQVGGPRGLIPPSPASSYYPSEEGGGQPFGYGDGYAAPSQPPPPPLPGRPGHAY